MKKELLKLQNITSDLLSASAYSFRSCAIFLLFSVSSSYVSYLFWRMTGWVFSLIVLILSVIITIAYPIYRAIESKMTIAAINNGEFTVKEVYIRNKKKGLLYFKPRAMSILSILILTSVLRIPDLLFLLFYFTLYPNKFVLTDGSVYKFKLEYINIPSYYKWSEYGEMSVDSIYETAELGEKLYVVSVGRKRNVMCYNARMFEPYGFTVEDSHADRQQDGENSPE